MQTFLISYPDEYHYWAEPVVKAINIVLSLISLVAITSIVLQYGFYLSEQNTAITNRINLVIVQFYLCQFILKFILSKSKLRFLKHRWFEASLALLILIEVAIIIRFVGFASIQKYFFDVDVTAITEIYIVVAQVLIILSIITEGVRYNTRVGYLKFHPSQTLIISFLLIIASGTGLLMLPRATFPGASISFLNALFTATSATCVTGLAVVDTATYFTRSGQIIILCLIQIGGLGLMTLSSFLALFFGQGIGIRERVALHQMLNIDKIGMIGSVLKNVILITFTIEALGAIFLIIFWADQGWELNQLLFNSIFHSISAFCNAGFSTFTDSLISHQNNSGVLLVISLLIILGGLGFFVLQDIIDTHRRQRKTQRRHKLKTQTRMVLLVTSILLVGGFISLYFLDTEQTGWHRVLTAFFNSVTSRTGGFNTIDIAILNNSSILIIMILMFIGASPGSTGGGIKTTTLGVLWASIIAIITGHNRIVIYKRRLPFLVLNRALVVFAFSVTVIVVAVLLLSITEQKPILNLLFEAVSAFSTTGLSMNLTSALTVSGKIIIVCLMFIGRLGALTLAFAITAPTEQPKARIEYPSESVMIG